MALAVTASNVHNNTANFYPANDQWRMVQLPIAASFALVDGGALGVEVSANTTTGNLVAMPATNANGKNFQGILAEPIAATDADYATAGKLKNVWVPVSESATAFFSVGAGTFTLADIFKLVSFHSDSKSLAVDTIGNGATILGFVSSTKGVCSFSNPTVIQS